MDVGTKLRNTIMLFICTWKGGVEGGVFLEMLKMLEESHFNFKHYFRNNISKIEENHIFLLNFRWGLKTASLKTASLKTASLKTASPKTASLRPFAKLLRKFHKRI